jgi:hypothetical protein
MLQTVQEPDGDGKNIVGVFEDGGILGTHGLGNQFQSDEDGYPKSDCRAKACVVKQNPEDECSDSHKCADKDSYLNELLSKSIGYQSYDNPENDCKHKSIYFIGNTATKLQNIT